MVLMLLLLHRIVIGHVLLDTPLCYVLSHLVAGAQKLFLSLICIISELLWRQVFATAVLLFD